MAQPCCSSEWAHSTGVFGIMGSQCMALQHNFLCISIGLSHMKDNTAFTNKLISLKSSAFDQNRGALKQIIGHTAYRTIWLPRVKNVQGDIHRLTQNRLTSQLLFVFRPFPPQLYIAPRRSLIFIKPELRGTLSGKLVICTQPNEPLLSVTELSHSHRPHGNTRYAWHVES